MQDVHLCGQDGRVPGHSDVINRSKGDFRAILPVLKVKHLFNPLGYQTSPSPPQPAVGLLWGCLGALWTWSQLNLSLFTCVCSVLLPQRGLHCGISS